MPGLLVLSHLRQISLHLLLRPLLHLASREHWSRSYYTVGRAFVANAVPCKRYKYNGLSLTCTPGCLWGYRWLVSPNGLEPCLSRIGLDHLGSN